MNVLRTDRQVWLGSNSRSYSSSRCFELNGEKNCLESQREEKIMRVRDEFCRVSLRTDFSVHTCVCVSYVYTYSAIDYLFLLFSLSLSFCTHPSFAHSFPLNGYLLFILGIHTVCEDERIRTTDEFRL